MNYVLSSESKWLLMLPYSDKKKSLLLLINKQGFIPVTVLTTEKISIAFYFLKTRVRREKWGMNCAREILL
jgi:hypothetical protein